MYYFIVIKDLVVIWILVLLSPTHSMAWLLAVLLAGLTVGKIFDEIIHHHRVHIQHQEMSEYLKEHIDEIDEQLDKAYRTIKKDLKEVKGKKDGTN